jgi:DNA (cytosine-5)-methyltransferase 1
MQPPQIYIPTLEGQERYIPSRSFPSPSVRLPISKEAEYQLFAHALALYLTRYNCSPEKRIWTITDGFCGAGGSSLGARNAGLWVRFAMNHSPESLQTHAYNFPECEHWQVNISAIDPHETPNTDYLWKSPECTNHSNSKGKKFDGVDMPGLWTDREEDEMIYRSRMTMFDVVRFTKAKIAAGSPYKAIFVENVVEARSKWPYFQPWIDEMTDLGYEHKCLYLNAQFFSPTPQSRDRFYCVFWHKDLPAPDLTFSPLAFCTTCEEQVSAYQHWKNPLKPYGKYQKQYVYRCPKCRNEVRPYYYAALNAIDWSIEAPKIKDRHKYKRLKQLKEKTTTRIQAGLELAFQEEAKSLIPFVLDVCRTYADDDYTHLITSTLPTQTTAQSLALVIPPGSNIVSGANEPYIVDWARIQSGLGDRPLPFLVSYYSNGKPVSSLEPVGTLTSKPRYGVIQPPVAERSYTGRLPEIGDCTFRMLSGEESKRAMGFYNADSNQEYTIIAKSEEERVRQCGLAVCPPVAQWIIERTRSAIESAFSS